MKVSDITIDQVLDYLRIDDASEIETAEVQMFMDSAKATILATTGLTQSEVDEHADMVHPYLLLISDQFDNRNGMIENKQATINHSIMETLRRHAKNYV